MLALQAHQGRSAPLRPSPFAAYWAALTDAFRRAPELRVWLYVLMADALTTHIAVTWAGASEGNPLLNASAGFVGLPVTLMLKTVVGAAIGLLLVRTGKPQCLRMLNFGLGAVVAFNVLVIVTGLAIR